MALGLECPFEIAHYLLYIAIMQWNPTYVETELVLGTRPKKKELVLGREFTSCVRLRLKDYSFYGFDFFFFLKSIQEISDLFDQSTGFFFDFPYATWAFPALLLSPQIVKR